MKTQKNKDLIGHIANPRDICRIYSLNGATLLIIDENIPIGAHSLYSTNAEIRRVMQKDINKAIKDFVYCYDDNVFILNIHHAGNSCPIAYNSLNWNSWYVKEQMDLYMPIIKHFLWYGMCRIK